MPRGGDPRQVESVTVYLVALYLTIEKKMPEEKVNKAMEYLIQKHKRRFQKLDKPSFRG